jgi:hypothetical protein
MDLGLDAIPAELRERREWVVWRFERRGGDDTKVLYVARPPLDRGAATGREGVGAHVRLIPPHGGPSWKP